MIVDTYVCSIISIYDGSLHASSSHSCSWIHKKIRLDAQAFHGGGPVLTTCCGFLPARELFCRRGEFIV